MCPIPWAIGIGSQFGTHLQYRYRVRISYCLLGYVLKLGIRAKDKRPNQISEALTLLFRSEFDQCKILAVYIKKPEFKVLEKDTYFAKID